MPGRDIIVVGASAGGVEAVANLAQTLPANLSAAVFVVVHIPAIAKSRLPEILSRAGPLPAVHPADGDPIEPSQIYVAPPDHHLLVQRSEVRVTRGPRENRQRPAVDPLFRTAARWYGPRVIGVVLSGSLDDGTAGLHVVRRRGGVAVVQDPNDALFAGMPRSAIDNAGADAILPVSEMGSALDRLTGEMVSEEGVAAVDGDLGIESEIPTMHPEAMTGDDRPGLPSGFACPECGGALWELREGGLFRFRCRVGHAFSAENLLAEQAAGLEAAMWIALRNLEEQAALARRLARRSRERGQALTAARFDEQEREAEQHASMVRGVLQSGDRPLDLAEAERGSHEEKVDATLTGMKT